MNAIDMNALEVIVKFFLSTSVFIFFVIVPIGVYRSNRIDERKYKQREENKNHIKLSTNSISFDFSSGDVLPQVVTVNVCSLLPVKPREADKWNWNTYFHNDEFSILSIEGDSLVILPKPRKDDRVGDCSIKLFINNEACNDSAVLTIEIKGNPNWDEGKDTDYYYEY